jgi:hypothetical protein
MESQYRVYPRSCSSLKKVYVCSSGVIVYVVTPALVESFVVYFASPSELPNVNITQLAFEYSTALVEEYTSSILTIGPLNPVMF